MIGAVTTASAYALSCLREGLWGRVHSVYRKTVNVVFEGQLLSLQAEGSPLSPISLITALGPEELAGLPLEPGQPVRVAGGAVLIGDRTCPERPVCRFLLPRGEGVALELQAALPLGQTEILENNLRSALQQTARGGFALLGREEAVSRDPVLQVAHSRIAGCVRLCRQQQWQAAADQLVRLVGLGPGLTPSGDDFLTGVLAGMILCDSRDHPLAAPLSAGILACLENTNDISAAFLRCALQGQFSAPVKGLTLCPSARRIQQEFEAIGHTSGMDTLCGVGFALRIMGDKGSTA